MKAHEVKEKVKNEANRLGIHFNQALTMLAYERVIARLMAVKSLQESLIFKGGMVMRVVYGSDRFTMDLDMSYDSISMEKLKKSVEDAMTAKFDDGFEFGLIGWDVITEHKNYPGIRLSSHFSFEKTKIQVMQMDFTVIELKDSFIQKNIRFILESEKMVCNVYSVEQILAEKIEALVDRGEFSNRSKDIYDINHLLQGKVDYLRLKKKVDEVFEVRKTEKPTLFGEFFEELNTTALRGSWVKLGKLMPSRQPFDKMYVDFKRNMTDLDLALSKA